jgi:very-short-patch-repair endonuclease
MAYKVAYGKDIRKSDYGGGMETVRFFERLGFEMHYTGKSDPRDNKAIQKKPSKNEKGKVELNNDVSIVSNKKQLKKITMTSKNVIEDKNNLQLLLNRIYNGDIVCEKTFPWLKSPKQIEGVYKDLYRDLSNYRGDSTFAKKNVSLRCDFVCESEKIIIEYDERQHFTEARKISLLSYKDIKLDYDRELWIEACEAIQAKDNHPFNRDEARAYYDSVRDIEAKKNGYKLVRIMHGQIDFESDKAESELKRLLGIDKSSEIEERKTKSKPKNGLKIGMYLQTDELKNKEDFNKVLKEVKESEFDIFVLPEFSYFPFVNLVEESDIADKDDFNKICQLSLDLSEEMEKAIVISSIDKYGTIFSLYANAFASTEETELGLYIKHTMTSYSAFDFEQYKEISEIIFEPIIYKEYKIGLTIGCGNINI